MCMPLDELEQLSDLVRLRLPVNFLQVQELRDTRVDEDVMASVHPTEAEPECYLRRRRIASSARSRSSLIR
jgi:hypothetical protein